VDADRRAITLRPLTILYSYHHQSSNRTTFKV
jgi:hypothetical protein